MSFLVLQASHHTLKKARLVRWPRSPKQLPSAIQGKERSRLLWFSLWLDLASLKKKVLNGLHSVITMSTGTKLQRLCKKLQGLNFKDLASLQVNHI